MKVKGKSLSHVQLLATPWTAAYEAPLFIGFSRQEYWSGVPLPSPIPTIRYKINCKGAGPTDLLRTCWAPQAGEVKFPCCPAVVSACLLSVLWVQGILAVRTGDTSDDKADGAAATPPSRALTLMPAVGKEGALPWTEVGAPGCREQPEWLDGATARTRNWER